MKSFVAGVYSAYSKKAGRTISENQFKKLKFFITVKEEYKEMKVHHFQMYE